MRKDENSVIISYIIVTVVIAVLAFAYFYYALTPEVALSEPISTVLYK